MGPRLIRLLPLLALAVVGCGAHVAPSESLESKLKEANQRANDGTSIPKAHSAREATPRT